MTWSRTARAEEGTPRDDFQMTTSRRSQKGRRGEEKGDCFFIPTGSGMDPVFVALVYHVPSRRRGPCSCRPLSDALVPLGTPPSHDAPPFFSSPVVVTRLVSPATCRAGPGWHPSEQSVSRAHAIPGPETPVHRSHGRWRLELGNDLL